MCACVRACVRRPLTQEEIAQRRELARQRHADRLTADQKAAESHEDLTHSGSAPQEAQPAGHSTGKLNNTIFIHFLLEGRLCNFP